MNDFDRMYNEYFGDNEENEPRLPKSVERMFNLVDKLNQGGLDDSSLEEDTLGEPTSKRIVLIEGVKFEESIWETPEGSIVRMKALEPQIIDMKNLGELGNIMNGFFKKVETLKEKTPQELLDEAIEDEDYEEAAKLRDIIEGKKETSQERLDKILNQAKERQKKLENKETGENLNNKGFPEDNDWNF